MSNTKTVMSQAANTQGLPLDITDVFSTYLYTGTGSAQTITNGIDLAGEGGLVWTKSRSTQGHVFCDTEQGVGKYLSSNQTWSTVTNANVVNAFNSDGYSIGSEGDVNANTYNFASWTFRKAPKFFDVVTYTGTGSAQTVAHNLGIEPGCIIIKETSATRNWYVYHRSTGNTKYLYLNLTDAAATSSLAFNNTDPTDAEFTVGTINGINNSGATYVAYLFAHNDGDGGFGPNGDADIIKCGSYTGNGSTDGPEIDLGFEPQWVLVRGVDSNFKDWVIIDNMRGFVADGNDSQALFANKTNAETARPLAPLSTGFKPTGTSSDVNTNNETYIYIAIRRGPLAPPESGTEVFAVDTGSTNDPAFDSGFPVDFAIFTETNTNTDNDVATRLLGTDGLRTNSTAAAVGPFSDFKFDFMDGWNTAGYGTNTVSWMWKRAPSFFDVVTYTGDDAASQTVPHNLGVAPEMMIVKSRNITASWFCYHKDIGNTKTIYLNSTNAAKTASSGYWNNTTPTETSFTVGVNPNQASWGGVISYLFATLAGVSKVGSYTGNGSSQTIDCGFTTGARFILIKRTDSTGDWYVWDTERGIVAGNDPHLSLNTTAAEVTSDDSIDPDNSGFIVNQVGATNINVSSAEYIFYAVA
jgi:hypothetical protein